MRVKLKKINEQVIVVTGASSGIGLATALMAARRGAHLVLNSRDELDCSRRSSGSGPREVKPFPWLEMWRNLP